MSKSRGNLVALSDELAEHGVDAVRLTMVFAGPPEDDIDWADVSPAGPAQVPGAGVAAVRRRHERRRARTPPTGDLGAAQGHAPRGRTRRRGRSSRSASTSPSRG